ncbi:MAG: STAS domain-containing protein [Rhodanobacteraceae bacterium]|nr:STAS domain-containing protein [Rhodanobacteraceae bacterium]
MQIDLVQEGNVTVLCPRGRIDSSTSPAVERACDDQIARGSTRLLFDLAHVDYVSSAGLRVFLVAGKKAQRAGGRIALCNLQSTVREILAIAGFDRILTTAASRGEGLAKLI